MATVWIHFWVLATNIWFFGRLYGNVFRDFSCSLRKSTLTPNFIPYVHMSSIANMWSLPHIHVFFPHIYPIYCSISHGFFQFLSNIFTQFLYLPKLVNIFHHFPHIFKIFRVTAPYFFSPPRQSVSGTHLSRAVSAWAEPGSSAEEKTQVQLSKSAPEVDEISPVDGCFIP
jgi:hypothetical protein